MAVSRSPRRQPQLGGSAVETGSAQAKLHQAAPQGAGDFLKSSLWKQAIKNCSDSARAQERLGLLADALPKVDRTLPAAALPDLMSPEQARVLCELFSGSLALSGVLCAKPNWLERVAVETLQKPRRKEGLAQEVAEWMELALAMGNYGGAMHLLREFKQRETLRIGARDLARFSNAPEITQELSDLADVCLGSVWRVCLLQLTARHGAPFHQLPDGAWKATGACVFGMGKLGGQELNYSSDVDVIFAYEDEGSVFKLEGQRPSGVAGSRKKQGGVPPGKPGISNHQFFNRVAEAFIAEVSRMTPEGSLYRIDLRLRPEGDSGPLSRSLSSYENYYAQWGQTWERMMLIKARKVAGDDSIAGEFLEMTQPFRHPRSINSAALREVAAMKDRIEAEVVKAGELDRNVKLGRGGIREIEFTAQALQLLHAGRQPFLQTARTLPCLEKLAAYEHLSQADARGLRDAYCFLRDVEHRAQMEDNRQTHTIPGDNASLERMARLMGFKAASEFESARSRHAKLVRSVFERILRGKEGETRAGTPFPSQFEGEEPKWKALLSEHGFRDVDKAYRVLREFAEGPGYVHVSPRTTELAHGLLPRLFALCRGGNVPSPAAREPVPARAADKPRLRLSDPDRVVTRLDSFIAAYGARATLFELWHSSPAIFELLILLFDRSEFLAELAIRTPDLVDELVAGERLRQKKPAAETLADLRHGIADQDQGLWLRRYHQAELMRIGLRDILGLADPEQYLDELSSLADACLTYALEVVTRKHKLKAPSFCIVGLGKLGGAEIDYGSDLDIIFVAANKAPDLRKLSKMAVELMELISSRTEQGMVFQMDARLRPDGEKGLLVNTLKAYEEYYRNRALLWEIQALSRARVIAGNPAAGGDFETLAARLANFKKPDPPLAAFGAGWKGTIHQMRMRIEKERTPKGKEHLAIKTGAGGLVDAEFLAQALCLENGWREPNTMRALERGAREGALQDATSLIDGYRFLRRVEGILRRWSYEGETVLPDDPAPFYRVAARCGFETSELFSDALARSRARVRAAYSAFFA